MEAAPGAADRCIMTAWIADTRAAGRRAVPASRQPRGLRCGPAPRTPTSSGVGGRSEPRREAASRSLRAQKVDPPVMEGGTPEGTRASNRSTSPWVPVPVLLGAKYR